MKSSPKVIVNFESNSKNVKSYKWFRPIKNMKKYTLSKAYKMFKGIIEINPSLCFIDDAIIEVCGKTKISCLQIQEQAYILSQIAKFER